MDEPQKPTESVDEDIISAYANNVAIEQTVWDLKLIFGEFSGRSNSVEWHTSMTLPWAQAKLLAYYLRVNIAVWELRNGLVKIPEPMLPPELPPLTEEEKRDPLKKTAMETIRRYQSEFLEQLKKEQQK